MEYLSAKEIAEYTKRSRQAVEKATKGVSYILQKRKGSTRPVKCFKIDELPNDYQKDLREQGIKPEVKEDTNISKANFTKVYLLASPAKQLKAQLKCKLVEFYLKRDTSSGNQKQWLEQTLQNDLTFDELGKVSIKQLNDWIKKYSDAKAKGENVVECFIDVRGRKKGVIALTEDMKEVAQRHFLKTSRPRISEIYRNMCHQFGSTMPSQDVLYSYFEEWKTENPVLFEFSKSPDSAKNKYLAAYGDMSAKAKHRNHYVELDSTPADVICADGKRYAVLAAIDIHTRRGVFHVADTSSSFTISQLLRKYILKFGIPDNVVIDNGKDYTSNHFQSVCSNLGINMVVVPPYSGECKPFVERWFGTLSRELFEQVEGYIGHNVAQREELQARKSFSDKIEAQRKWQEKQNLMSDEEKKAWSDAWKLKKENKGLELGILLNADELQQWIDNWNSKIYEQRVHKGIKTTPLKMWEKEFMPVNSIGDERMLDLLLGESFMRKVGKKGISFDGCQYAHLDLVEHTGDHVFVMTPIDMGYILVYDGNMKFICTAEDLEHMGQDRFKVRGAKKKSQALMRQLEKIRQEAMSVDDVTIKDRIEAVESVIEVPTIAVTKHTEAVDALLTSSPEIEAKDKEDLEQSNKYDFKNKDEEGKPTKVLPSGRPAFKSFYDRALWDLKNKMVDESTNKLANKYPDIWESAKKEYKRSA